MNLKVNRELSVRFRDWPISLSLLTKNFYHYNIRYHHWQFKVIKLRYLSDL